jgi:hypothetical protein
VVNGTEIALLIPSARWALKLCKGSNMLKSLLCAAALAAAVMTTPAAAVNLVTNGSFETGDFTGWSETGDTSFTGVIGSALGFDPTDGVYQGIFGPVGGLVYISQDIVTTPGASYLLSFDIGNTGGTPSEFVLAWDGITLLDIPDLDPFPYMTASGGLTATTSLTTLTFGFFQEPDYFFLDNVVLTAIPEPASWALMLAGFGMIGGAMRRRQIALAA